MLEPVTNGLIDLGVSGLFLATLLGFIYMLWRRLEKQADVHDKRIQTMFDMYIDLLKEQHEVVKHSVETNVQFQNVIYKLVDDIKDLEKGKP